MCGGMNEKRPNSLQYLNSWSPAGGTVCGDLGDETLLEKYIAKSRLGD